MTACLLGNTLDFRVASMAHLRTNETQHRQARRAFHDMYWAPSMEFT